MDEQNNFCIAFRQLPDGTHRFDYKVQKPFFDSIESSLVGGGDLTASVVMVKTPVMLKLRFAITGTVRVACDRCLGEFDYPVKDCGGDIVVRFGKTNEEVSEDLYVVGEEEDELDLSQWIYEFICVSLPIRFEHPLDADGNSTCDPEMIARLDNYLVTEKTGSEASPCNAGTDPRWDALKGLLNNNQ